MEKDERGSRLHSMVNAQLLSQQAHAGLVPMAVSPRPTLCVILLSSGVSPRAFWLLSASFGQVPDRKPASPGAICQQNRTGMASRGADEPAAPCGLLDLPDALLLDVLSRLPLQERCVLPQLNLHSTLPSNAGSGGSRTLSYPCICVTVL